MIYFGGKCLKRVTGLDYYETLSNQRPRLTILFYRLQQTIIYIYTIVNTLPFQVTNTKTSQFCWLYLRDNISWNNGWRVDIKSVYESGNLFSLTLLSTWLSWSQFKLSLTFLSFYKISSSFSKYHSCGVSKGNKSLHGSGDRNLNLPGNRSDIRQ